MSIYLPRAFEEKDPAVMHAFMRAHPFATLIVQTPEGPDATHIPFVLKPEQAPFGTLQAHVSRANHLWETYDRDTDALVTFTGPHAYVTPDWYPRTHVDGKAVPTWDYVAVHARGRMRVIDDAAWMDTFLHDLTAQHETGRPTPWKMSDAPADYVASMARAVVGIEITITQLIGKWKASQNHPLENRLGVVEGLRREGDETGKAMADVVEQRLADKP